MAEHGMVRRVEERFHRRPFPQERLPHLIAQTSERSKLRLQGEFIFTVDILQEAGSADVLKGLRKLFWLHIPTLDPVVFEQLPLGEGFERTNERDHGCFRVLQTM